MSRLDSGANHRCAFSWMIIGMLTVMILFRADISSGTDIALIDVDTLQSDLSAWTVLDARPAAQYLAGHIPGAQPFSWENHTRVDAENIPYRTFPPEEMAQALGRMGITEKTPIVIYGDADTSWGGEGWCCWVLAWMGHQGPIRVLDGGIRAWKATHPLQNGLTAAKRDQSGYRFRISNQCIIEAEDIRSHPAAYTLVDTRAWMEWVKGSLPNAVHIPWTDFYTGSSRQPLSAAALAALLKKHGVRLDRPVVYFCTGGIRSGYAWMVHDLAGLPTAMNFEGGVEAWNRVGKRSASK